MDSYTSAPAAITGKQRRGMTNTTTTFKELTFTLDEIRRAYWRQYHKAGELWFDYLGSDKENEQATAAYWKEFEESLKSLI